MTALVVSFSGVGRAEPQADIVVGGRPFLSPIFGDHMVLQRGKPNSLWGWTVPGRTVAIEVGGHKASAVAGADGKWMASVGVPPVGGPYVVKIDGPESVVLHDVLVGDVWICAGQSNMLFALREADGGAEEAKQAEHENLRFFAVGQRVAYAPVATPAGNWTTCTPGTAADFSAVAYFFGMQLESKLNVPIGLVVSAVGGSPNEAWMSSESLEHAGEFVPQLAEIARLHASGKPEIGSFLMHWLDEYDVGGKGDAWAKPDFDDAAWRIVQLPADSRKGNAPGVDWYRKEIDVPDPVPAGVATIHLGSVEKMETTYVNGTWVGASSWVENPRAYVVPAGILHPGRNVIAIRNFKMRSAGGFLDHADSLHIDWTDGTAISLAGPWKTAVSVDARPPHPVPLDLENYPTMPTVLYNSMLEPLAPLAITGTIWYQGEANWPHPGQYRKLLPALIANWRSLFRQGDFPFYIVSLPAFNQRTAQPIEDGWAAVRAAQIDVGRTTPGCGTVITVDIGDANNIHPRKKREVGDRLARLALARHYGRTVVDSGPTMRSVERNGSSMKVSFDHADGGLVVHGDSLGEFFVAGEDRHWHAAQARIEGNAVIVSAPGVSAPVAVRYAWQANPAAMLYNGEGLPAVPFRSDDWPAAASGQEPH